MVVVADETLPERKRRVVWLSIGVACILLVAAVATVVVWSQVSSVPVTFVNDTSQTVIIPDCGSDLTQIEPGQSTDLSLKTNSRHCTVDRPRGGNEVILGCLDLPSPLTPHSVFRVSDARSVSRTNPCG